MAAFSRGSRFSAQLQILESVRTQCVRYSTSNVLRSGHSRWSKIKHDKGAADAKKSNRNKFFAAEITAASKLYGADPALNPRLATAIATAKKAAFPKASIEAAIARGQGVSATGVSLESLTLEAIMPPSHAFVVDIETDNRKRALADIRHVITRRHGTITPTSYLFKKRGIVTFDRKDGVGLEEVLEEAIDAGAEDVEEDDDGKLIVWTEPSMTTKTAEHLRKSRGLEISSSEVIWDPNQETLVPIDARENALMLIDLVTALQDNSDVQNVYSNVSQGTVDDDTWSDLAGRLAS